MNNLEDKDFYSITSDDVESDIVIYTYVLMTVVAIDLQPQTMHQLRSSIVIKLRQMIYTARNQYIFKYHSKRR